MKKKILFLLSILIIEPVFAEVFFAPEWSEFAPNSYKNVSTDKFYLTESGRYWSERRKVFEKRLDKCNNLSEEAQMACYNELRQLEMNATQLRNERVKNNKFNAMLINSMF